MAYLIFGFALGLFICGLIEKFYKSEKSSWTKSHYLFLLSGVTFLVFLYVGWPLLQSAFSNIFS